MKLVAYLLLIFSAFSYAQDQSVPVPQTRTVEERIISKQRQELELMVTQLEFKKKNYPAQFTMSDQKLYENLSERYFNLTRDLMMLKQLNGQTRSVQTDRANRIKD